MFVIGAAVWVAIAVVWCLRLALTAARSGLRMPVAAWARWMTIPAAMGLVFVIGLSGVLFGERFAASRGALDRMAAEVMAGGSTERGWVGLYDVGQVERTANGFRFVIDDSGLFRIGVAYRRPANRSSPRTTTRRSGRARSASSLWAVAGGCGKRSGTDAGRS